MFKKTLFILTLLLTTSPILAQIGSAKSKIVLNFREQQSLVISHPSVDINLNKGAEYAKGVETGMLKNHLIIQCSTPYELSVRSINAYFQYENSLSGLPVSIIRIKPNITTSTALDFPLQLHPVDLTINPQLIIQSNNRGNSQQIDVNYTIPVQNIGQTLNQKAGSYQTTIVYTLLPH
ncbi:hypothetical protein M2306_003356 [Myroides gitamensis]|uniref:hypothetical protein n=1 Tax=Myroides odoratus TaxID=256 RepID=UPI002169A97E|nr:hypothetical protein [Myroides odoratus]MCS4238897.1 hypothetical protein [Myroides odoratus]MDH6602662.1 hypothetical protein [Myroides gitamensis]